MSYNCYSPKLQAFKNYFLFLYVQVAERALFLWNNDHIENLIKQNRKVILPIVIPALEKNSRSHWNQAVQSLTLNVRKIFSDSDPELFEECLLQFQEDEKREEEIKKKREATWKLLEEIAARKAASTRATTRTPSWMIVSFFFFWVEQGEGNCCYLGMMEILFWL